MNVSVVTAGDIDNLELFKGLTTADLEKIAAICLRQTFTAGAVIFDPFSYVNKVYFVAEGQDRVQIEIPLSGYSSKIVVHTLAKGEVFGWVALGPAHSRTALARCLDNCTLISLEGEDLLRLLDAIISSRLSYTTIIFRREISRLIRKQTADMAV
jgi:CRP-like cAMP-binding protein